MVIGDDMMESIEDKLILQIKARFFDIIYTENTQVNYGGLLQKMLFAVKESLDAEEITLYHCNEWNHSLFVEASTNLQAIGSIVPAYSCTQLEDKISNQMEDYRQFPIPYFQKYDLFLPLKSDNEIISYMVIKESESSQNTAYGQDLLRKVCSECATFVKKAQTLSKILFEEKRYKQLYRVTSKFHSSMDMDGVLGEIIHTLQEVYTTFTHYLLLSQDTTCHCDLPVKDLQYDSENIAAMQAYLTGAVQIEECKVKNLSILYAPLKGKQGVYGILQVNAPNTIVFPKNEINFIELLANTGGGALENAQLYQQSKRLISDLQLINETSHRLNSNLRLNESITYICEQIINSFDADEVGFILFSSDLDPVQVLPGSTDFFLEAEAEVYINYMSEKIKKEKDSFFIGDLNLQSDEMKNMKYRSIMGVPMVESDQLKGFSIVMHQDSYHFSFEAFKLLQSLIHHSTLAISNSMLHEELEKMVITDHLTKLYSRNYLDDMIQMSMKNDAYGTFILIDIDDFKKINDTHGHQIGDEVLVQVANIIKNNIRSTDIGARWGGEELAIYLPRISFQDGIIIAERFLQKVATGTNPKVTISVGVSFWNKDECDSVKELFQRADRALYEAKRTGKNKVVIQAQR